MKPYIAIATIIATALTLFVGANNAEARKIKTNHKIPQQTSKQKDADTDIFSSIGTTKFTADSIAVWDEISKKIRFYGFDKTTNSNLESFFITNGNSTTLRAVGFDIIYFDMKGRQLHRRYVDLKCNVAPGETMRHDIKSWDTQKSFYFHQSAKPRRQSTPFDVKIELKVASLDL